MSIIGSRANLVLNVCCRNNFLFVRYLSLSQHLKVKEVIEKKEGHKLFISAKVKSQDDPFLMKKSKEGACSLCAYGLEVKHTDVLIINQFLDKEGKLMRRAITGLCCTQHKRMDYLVEMARAAGLLSKSFPQKEVTKDTKWKKLNTYFEEDTIKFRYF